LVGLRDKIPDIQKTLDTVNFLKARKVSPSRMEGKKEGRKEGRKEGWWWGCQYK